MDEDQAPSTIVPETGPKRTFGDRLTGLRRAVTTRKGLLGEYDCQNTHHGTDPGMISRALSAHHAYVLSRCLSFHAKPAIHEETNSGSPLFWAQR